MYPGIFLLHSNPWITLCPRAVSPGNFPLLPPAGKAKQKQSPLLTQGVALSLSLCLWVNEWRAFAGICILSLKQEAEMSEVSVQFPWETIFPACNPLLQIPTII